MPKSLPGAISILGGDTVKAGPLTLNFQTPNILDENEPLTVDIQPGSAPSALWDACAGNPALRAELQMVLSATYRAGWNEGMLDAEVKFVA